MLICIDAGHGRHTAGKRCMKQLDPEETREWVLNARIADKVQDVLNGFRCTTMRADDPTGQRDVPLAQRVAAANQSRADFYLSIHHNAGIRGGEGGGVMVFTAPTCQETSKTMQEAAYRQLVRQTGLEGNRARPMDSQNLYVLKRTRMPAILCECGFMDSQTDTPIILTERFANRAAYALAEAIIEVFGLERKDKEPAPEEREYRRWVRCYQRYCREEGMKFGTG